MDGKFTEIVAPTVRELFENQLEDRIFSGSLKPGDKLPSERELAAQMKISKSIVHLGIADLENKGFLVTVPRRGIYVSDYSKTGKTDALLALLRYRGGHMDRATITSIVQLRVAVEGSALRMLAVSHTKEMTDALMRDAEEVEKALTKDRNGDLAADRLFQFDLDVCIFCGNSIYPLLMNSFRELTRPLWKIWYATSGARNTVTAKRAYIRLIVERNPDAVFRLFAQNSEAFLKGLREED